MDIRYPSLPLRAWLGVPHDQQQRLGGAATNWISKGSSLGCAGLLFSTLSPCSDSQSSRGQREKGMGGHGLWDHSCLPPLCHVYSNICIWRACLWGSIVKWMTTPYKWLISVRSCVTLTRGEYRELPSLKTHFLLGLKYNIFRVDETW